jgi:predicted Fe-S protein YdhL (DUF1289 family)
LAADTPGGEIVPSPCNLVCTLNAADICYGCGRSADEIGEWSRATPERQREIVEAAKARQTLR